MTEQQNDLLVIPDFSSAPDRVGPGIYKVRIKDSKMDKWEKTDQTTGEIKTTRFINWRLETFDEADSKNNGRAIFHRTPIENEGVFRLKDFYQAAMGEELKGAFDRSMLYGREIEVTIAPQKNAPQYTEIKAVKPIAH